jgi:peptidoglycan-associated lipoprotein
MSWFRRKDVVVLVFIVLLFTAASCRKRVAAAPTPPPPPPPPVAPPTPSITLRAQPATIERGQSAQLQWEARNAATVQIEPEVGQVAATGMRQVNPTSSVTYTARATGPGGEASDTARITVNVPPPPPVKPPPPPPTKIDKTLDELFRENVREIYFDYDKSDIRPMEVSKLQGNANWLKQNADVRFTIEGHCDERGSEEYNLGLGDRRANAVKEFLLAQGVAASRINTVSYGEERPVCRDQNEDCYQRNRRAAFTKN